VGLVEVVAAGGLVGVEVGGWDELGSAVWSDLDRPALVVDHAVVELAHER
jgi:hypothetical protein